MMKAVQDRDVDIKKRTVTFSATTEIHEIPNENTGRTPKRRGSRDSWAADPMYASSKTRDAEDAKRFRSVAEYSNFVSYHFSANRNMMRCLIRKGARIISLK